MAQRFRIDKKFKPYFPITPDIAEAVKQGKKFIVVRADYSGGVPDGLEMFEIVYGSQVFKAMMPRASLRMYARAGEGDAKLGLDELADCYQDIKAYENKMIEEGLTSCQEMAWATSTREKYVVWATDYLTKVKHDTAGAEIIEFDEARLKEFCLNDSNLESILKEIAALQLDVESRELREVSELSQYAKHVTKIEYDDVIADIMQVRCDCGSHVEIRTQFRQRSVRKTIDIPQDSTGISSLMDKVIEYQRENSENWTGFHERHASNITKHYINIKYIYPTNPGKEFELTPPDKVD